MLTIINTASKKEINFRALEGETVRKALERKVASLFGSKATIWWNSSTCGSFEVTVAGSSKGPFFCADFDSSFPYFNGNY